MGYKNVNGLMRHLRESGVEIHGTKQKRQLLNAGYYHGYKGYRFFNKSNCRIPYVNYEEINATIKFDSKLKVLFYDKIMYIETAVKNIALCAILESAKSENIKDMYDKVLCGYNNCPDNYNDSKKEKSQKKKLNIITRIHNYLSNAYKSNNPIVTHFYNMGYNDVPLWALFEIIMLGDFGELLSCLDYKTRDKISQDLIFNYRSDDTNRELIYKYIYLLKELRNAVAHNSVVFDTRFRNFDPCSSMKRSLKERFKLNYVNFKSIDDYIFLICYYLSALKVPKSEIKKFLRDYKNTNEEYQKSVSLQVYNIVVNKDLMKRIEKVEKNL